MYCILPYSSALLLTKMAQLWNYWKKDFISKMFLDSVYQVQFAKWDQNDLSQSGISFDNDIFIRFIQTKVIF